MGNNPTKNKTGNAQGAPAGFGNATSAQEGIPSIPVFVSRGSDAKIDPVYKGSEYEVINRIIQSELKSIGYGGEELPVLRKARMKMTVVFSVITAIWVVLTRFRAGGFFTFLEVAALILYVIFVSSYDMTDYVKREIKARPDDNISNVVAGLVAGSLPDSQGADAAVLAKRGRRRRLAVILLSFLVPGLFFLKPHTLYEEADGGKSFHVRFYTEGLLREEKVTIPGKHNGKPVTGIRGNVFEGVKAREIELPDSITTIRGHAFENMKKLEYIRLPEKLTYLGAGAFKNCKSLREIELPDTLSEIRGETFSGCESLKSVLLPTQITEIHGNTFENCYSLKKIEIPEGVTRIGGHAFHSCHRLEEAVIPYTVNEIGSSAFRQCERLESIDLPAGCEVNERAFKNSPTQINWY